MKKLYHAAGEVSLRLPRWIDRSRTTARAALRYKLGTLTTVASSLHQVSQLYGIHFHGNFRRQNNIAVETSSFQQDANRAAQYHCQSFDKALCDPLWIYIFTTFTLALIFFSILSSRRAVHLHVIRDSKIKSGGGRGKTKCLSRAAHVNV